MRFMVIVKASPESEAGAMPNPELIEEMGQYNNELIAAGVMVDGAGLHPSSKAVRIDFSGAAPRVIDGPFTETKELIAGYWIWNCKDRSEAVSWLKRAPFRDGEVEIRPFFEPEDFEGIASPEIIEQEKGWREEQLGKASKGSA
jgi:hypothetical protein